MLLLVRWGAVSSVPFAMLSALALLTAAARSCRASTLRWKSKATKAIDHCSCSSSPAWRLMFMLRPQQQIRVIVILVQVDNCQGSYLSAVSSCGSAWHPSTTCIVPEGTPTQCYHLADDLVSGSRRKSASKGMQRYKGIHPPGWHS